MIPKFRAHIKILHRAPKFPETVLVIYRVYFINKARRFRGVGWKAYLGHLKPTVLSGVVDVPILRKALMLPSTKRIDAPKSTKKRFVDASIH